MSKKLIGALLMVIAVILTVAPALLAEELFDTATASKHMEQGITLLHAKKYDAAIKEFEESALVNPDAEAYYYLGYAYYLKGRSGDEESRKKARDNFSKAYEIDPNFSPMRFKATEAQHAASELQQENQMDPSESNVLEQPRSTQPTSTAAKPSP